MKIIRLTAENIKRLAVVEIAPDGNVITIGGKNGAGKSSVIDSIAYALGGRELVPDEPINKNKKGATIRVELEGLTVTREFWRSTKHDGIESKLVVQGEDGTVFKSPQAILNALLGRLSFDPLDFSRMKHTEQATTLRDVAGIDTTILDSTRQAAFDRRTALNRDLKRTRAVADSLPALDSELTADEVSLKDLSQKLTVALKAKEDLDALTMKISQSRDAIEKHKERIKDLENKLDVMHSSLEEMEETHTRISERREEMEVPDINAIEQEFMEAEKLNVRIRENNRVGEVIRELEELEAKVETEDQNILVVETEKTDMIRAAKYPIDGLRVDADGRMIFLNDIPFDQLSSAEQLRVSVAIGIALNPRLRVMLIRDGSLLDQESMKLLAEQASEADAQLWVERVTETTEGVAVFIEDGHVQMQATEE